MRPQPISKRTQPIPAPALPKMVIACVARGSYSFPENDTPYRSAAVGWRVEGGTAGGVGAGGGGADFGSTVGASLSAGLGADVATSDSGARRGGVDAPDSVAAWTGEGVGAIAGAGELVGGT